MQKKGYEQEFLTLFSQLYRKLFALGTLFGMVFGPLLTLIVKMITAPAIVLAKIIAYLFDGNRIIAG